MGPIYLADTERLPSTVPSVNRAFEARNIVVRQTSTTLNLVWSVLAFEHPTNRSKVKEGLASITHKASARFRLFLTTVDRSTLPDNV